MARRLYKRLTAAEVRQLAERPGSYADGDGLYLQVSKIVRDDGSVEPGSPSWVYRYLAGKRERFMGLGPLRHVSLAQARELADKARQLRKQGVDPIAARRAGQTEHQLKAAKMMSFADCAKAYAAAQATGWRSALHARQWSMSLETHVLPVFGNLPVAAIDVPLVLKAIEPIWNSKTETASRVRGRIEKVLDWATTRKYRTGENPARWKGLLETLLPKPSKVKEAARPSNGRSEHHAALRYAEIGAFMYELRQQSASAARALEFLILTAARSGEVLLAAWGEINFAERMWVIPKERMKAGKEHCVPLSDAALAILTQMASTREGDLVFPGTRTGAPLGAGALSRVLRRIRTEVGADEITVHGFRSTFRDWAAERTNYPSEIAEMALAHIVGSAVQRAYKRSDMFEKRRGLAGAWAAYCDQPSVAPEERGQVIPMRAAQ
jgi:integrase